MNWFIDAPIHPHRLELRVLEELAPQKYTVHYSGSNWCEASIKMKEWCSERFGHRDAGYNNPRWTMGPFVFRFKNQKDAVFFILRWG